MATIVIPHRGSNQTSQTTPVGDTITVGDTRVRNASQALTVVDSPSYAGSVAGRNWNNYFIEGLTGPCQGLYSGIPVVFQNPSTSALFVEYVYNHSGNTSEEATAGVVARNVFGGQRGDNFVSPYVTAVDTPRAVSTDPTLWTCIDLGGWGFHVTATGRVITMFGPALPDGVFPSLGGSRKTQNGTFPDGTLDGPNDICYDPGNPLIQYVADTFNDRIAKVHETSPGVVNVTTYFSTGLSDPYSLYPEADGTLIVADRGNNRVIRIPQIGGPGGTGRGGEHRHRAQSADGGAEILRWEYLLLGARRDTPAARDYPRHGRPPRDHDRPYPAGRDRHRLDLDGRGLRRHAGSGGRYLHRAVLELRHAPAHGPHGRVRHREPQ